MLTTPPQSLAQTINRPVFDLTQATAHVGELAPLTHRFDARRSPEAHALAVGAVVAVSARRLESIVAGIGLTTQLMRRSSAFASTGGMDYGQGNLPPSNRKVIDIKSTPSGTESGAALSLLPETGVQAATSIPALSWFTSDKPWKLSTATEQAIADIFKGEGNFEQMVKEAAKILVLARVAMLRSSEHRGRFDEAKIDKYLNTPTVIAGIEIKTREDISRALLKFIKEEFGLEFSHVPTRGELYKVLKQHTLADKSTTIDLQRIKRTTLAFRLYAHYSRFYRTAVSLYLPESDIMLLDPDLRSHELSTIYDTVIRVHEIEHRIGAVGGGYPREASKLNWIKSVLSPWNSLVSGPYRVYFEEGFSLASQWELLSRIPAGKRADQREKIRSAFDRLARDAGLSTSLEALRTSGIHEARKTLNSLPDGKLYKQLWQLYGLDYHLRFSESDKAIYLPHARLISRYDMRSLATRYHKGSYDLHKMDEMLGSFWAQQIQLALHAGVSTAGWYYGLTSFLGL